jgi:teichuronic acid biosynthesis glycosyltransferase TuaC
MNILVITTLYPNDEQFRHGIFIETRLRELQRYHPDYKLTVIAPVPKYPLLSLWRGRYKNIEIPEKLVRNGINVYHPNFFSIPFLGMYFNPFTLILGLKKFFRQHKFQLTDYDVIDCHYFYPDGYAASYFAKKHQRPLIVTARGSDIEILPSYFWPKYLIRKVISKCTYCGAVSNKLLKGLVDLGCETDKAILLPNGIDQELFKPSSESQHSLKVKFGITDHYTLLMVGNLVALKGHSIVLDALSKIDNINLLIVGDGPEYEKLQKKTTQLGLIKRVKYFGNKPQQELSEFYSCADTLVLMSSSEGWPNVLLEAMSCGASVISTMVGSSPEIVNNSDVGVLLSERTSEALLSALKDCVGTKFNRCDIRKHASNFSWKTTADYLDKIYKIAKNNGDLHG